VRASRKETTVELSVAAQRELGRAFVESLVTELATMEAGEETFSRLEEAVEAAVRRVGASVLTQVVAECGTGYEGASRPCACGGTQTTDHYRPRRDLPAADGAGDGDGAAGGWNCRRRGRAHSCKRV
jgi:hypothetical protein